MAKAPKGGRGKSQYLSTHVRMPDPLVEQCLKIRDRYWEYIENGGDPDNPPNYLAEEAHIEEPQTEESPAKPIYYERIGSQLYNLGDVDDW
ncbi:hypothetical protein H6F98_00945 [Microcoleus sp. FACHB-SPT15]|uniref:hypothetical protein n=1 Tax=Microcoleus sp. FACHB-SPT15 TaxID=2692830 RepID=UPI00177D185B|nr:hypothetical protein [Microcoleus sp. FACHB-SPT15]MBD1804041.1 hypothetical protein [Microcoleus sp. FACHB-SPT15]